MNAITPIIASTPNNVHRQAMRFGLAFRADDSHDNDDDAEIDDLVRRRDDARASKDFATADALRDELTARGIQLEDTPGGTIWHR